MLMNSNERPTEQPFDLPQTFVVLIKSLVIQLLHRTDQHTNWMPPAVKWPQPRMMGTTLRLDSYLPAAHWPKYLLEMQTNLCKEEQKVWDLLENGLKCNRIVILKNRFS